MVCNTSHFCGGKRTPLMFSALSLSLLGSPLTLSVVRPEVGENQDGCQMNKICDSCHQDVGNDMLLISDFNIANIIMLIEFETRQLWTPTILGFTTE